VAAGDVYRRIGVKPFINACGTRTIHSGTLMWPCVREAMDQASRTFVTMDELMEGVGARLAELTGADAAIVTSGGAGALCVAAATAVTGGDPEKILRLPKLEGLKDRVVMLKTGRFTYDQAIRAVGVTVIEVETKQEMVHAIEDERVAMIALLGTDEAEGRLSLEEIAKISRSRQVPILVDCASEHLVRPNPYLEAGATMVAYSGGKYLRGPQCTGLLLGSGGWIRAAWTNAAPHHTFGRMMKVGKEEIMGLLAAVEFWAQGRDDAAESVQWYADLETIAACVTIVAGVTTETITPRSEKSPTPRLEIRWDAKRIPLHGLTLRQALLDSEPRIMLDDRFSRLGSIFILPFSLQTGEAAVVGRRIAEVLAAASVENTREKPKGAPNGVVHGGWDVEIAYHAVGAQHRWDLTSEEDRVTGTHHTLFQANEIRGDFHGNHVRLVSEHRFEGTHLIYTFEGVVEGDAMEGRVEVGSEGQSAPGWLNRKEYGAYRWTASRHAR
jgi:D-glucosaminate-6-phosphate ammonia-lyase